MKINKKKTENKTANKNVNVKELREDFMKTTNNLKKEIKKNIKEEFILSGKNPLSAIKDGIVDLGKGIVDIAKAISGMFKYLGTLVRLIVWFIQLLIFIFTDLLRPDKLVKDMIFGGMSIAKSIINVIIRLIKTFGRYMINNLLGSFMNKIFGWDFNHKSIDNLNDKNKKCYKTDEGKIPNSVLISTIILPPLGVFMRFGLVNWVNILITCSLTLLFYFPGLIYALVLIYT